jgi:hypothetical protein
MSRLAELIEHPSRLLSRRHEPVTHHPRMSIAGIAVLLLAVVGLVWMWPDMKRYMRIRRM